MTSSPDIKIPEIPPAAFSAASCTAPAVSVPDMVVFRLSAMGDMVLTTGALSWWHEHLGLRFVLITRAAFAPLFQGHPAIVKIISLNRDDLRLPAFYKKCRALAAEYADKPLLDLHGNIRSRICSLLWKNKVFRYPKMALNRRVFLLSHGRFARAALLASHVTVRYAEAMPNCHPARKDVRPQIFLSDAEKDWAKQCLSSLFLIPDGSQTFFCASNPTVQALDKKTAPTLQNRGDSASSAMPSSPFCHPQVVEGRTASPCIDYSKKPNLPDTDSTNPTLLDASSFPQRRAIIALHPYSRHAAKSWSMPVWLDLATRIAERHDVLWIGQGAEIPANASGSSLVNKTDLRQLCAVLSQCDAVITGDSGPMHLASALGVPLVAIFGPTCEEWGFFPSGSNLKILQKSMPCRPCALHGQARCRHNHACLNDITPEECLIALEEVLTPPQIRSKGRA